LVARSWAEFAIDIGEEGRCFREIIEGSGQPALDLGCGSERLLLSYLAAGLDVDGCDPSQDMLAVCRERAEQEGLSPNLYAQAMHELDLPRRYRTIFACGVIGLGGKRLFTRQALRRCYEHLRPGGTFAFDTDPCYNDPPAWLSRLPENRHALPDKWPTSGERKPLADGTELKLVTRTISVDPLEEVQTRQIRARLWWGEELLEEEIHTMRYKEYGKNELVLMLELAGFADIQIYGGYRSEPATADHTSLVFVVKK
jgi:SAM-dependent methyltransferase